MRKEGPPVPGPHNGGPHSGPYQSQQPNATEDEKLAQACEILARMADGESIRAIARSMGLNRTTLYDRLALVRGELPTGHAASYYVAHDQTKKAKGRAADYLCRECGNPALHWAYNHEDPAELTWPSRGPYSLNPDCYVPMCQPCHRRFDVAHRRES